MEDKEIWSHLSAWLNSYSQDGPLPLTGEANKFSPWLFDGHGLPDLDSWLDYEEIVVKDQGQGQGQGQVDQPVKKKRGRKPKPFKLVRKERRRLSSLSFKALELRWVNLTAADFESSKLIPPVHTCFPADKLTSSRYQKPRRCRIQYLSKHLPESRS